MALGGFFNKLKAGLTRSTEKLTGGLTAAFAKRTLDDEALAELEELLLGADLGPRPPRTSSRASARAASAAA